jgi:DNA-binding transcriptional ArsR family regulator
MPRKFIHPKSKDFSLDGILHALSDPFRRIIVQNLLKAKGVSCNKSCDSLPASTLSFHFGILRESGLVLSEKKGVSLVNTLRKKEIDKKFPGLIESILRHNDTKTKPKRK